MSMSIEFEIIPSSTKELHKEWQKMMEPYKKKEYIPIHTICPLLSCTMPSSEIIHYYSQEHVVLRIKITDLLNAPITNWTYNRPPDPSRCPDIAKFIYTSRHPIDTVFYLIYNNEEERFEIIDGIHRFTALQMIQRENKKPLDFLTPGDFGGNNDAEWLFHNYVLVNIRFNCPLGTVIEAFRNLNKSNPVPDLYFRDIAKEKRNIIQNAVNQWQIKYAQHFSGNLKPNKPNVNRDRFIELLEKIYDKYKITEETQYVLETLLEHANTNIRRNLPKKISKSSLEKCQQSGCYLFLHSLEELEKII